MKNNDMSFESLYSAGLGLSSESLSPSIQSYEGYDGYEDGTAIELQHSLEVLDFLDTYSAIENNLASAKIRMCKKLSVNYGLKSGLNATAANSVESLCRKHILSLEDGEAAAETTETTSSPSDGRNEKGYYSVKNEFKNTKEKSGFMRAVFHALGVILKNIGNFIKRIFERIAGLFKGKQEKNIDKVANETIDFIDSSSSPSTIPSSVFEGKACCFDLSRGNVRINANSAPLGAFYKCFPKAGVLASSYLKDNKLSLLSGISNIFADMSVFNHAMGTCMSEKNILGQLEDLTKDFKYDKKEDYKKLGEYVRKLNNTDSILKKEMRDHKFQYKFIEAIFGLKCIDPSVGQKISKQQLKQAIKDITGVEYGAKEGTAPKKNSNYLLKSLDSLRTKFDELKTHSDNLSAVCEKIAQSNDNISKEIERARQKNEKPEEGKAVMKTILGAMIRFVVSCYNLLVQAISKITISATNFIGICKNWINSTTFQGKDTTQRTVSLGNTAKQAEIKKVENNF